MHSQKNNNFNTENCDTKDGWAAVLGTHKHRLSTILANTIVSKAQFLTADNTLLISGWRPLVPYLRLNSLSVAEKSNVYCLAYRLDFIRYRLHY